MGSHQHSNVCLHCRCEEPARQADPQPEGDGGHVPAGRAGAAAGNLQRLPRAPVPGLRAAPQVQGAVQQVREL